MSATEDSGRASPGGETRAGASGGADDRGPAQLFAAGRELLDSLRRLATGLLALVGAEARILRASVAQVFVASVVLVAFGVGLWTCLVALIGWALAVATHSVGIALALLVLLHLLLVLATWFTIRRAMRRATFPDSRAEFKAVRRTLRDDVLRFRQASAPARSEQGPST